MESKKDLYEKYEKKFNELFDELVPASGPAKTLGGEIIRALNRIKYRHWNDGDIAGQGYGKETVNPAVRYLLAQLPWSISPEIPMMNEIIEGKHVTDDEYETILNELTISVVLYVSQNDFLKKENTEDMFDYRKPEDVDDTNYEEDDDEYGDEY